MKQFIKIETFGDKYSIGELIEMIDDPHKVYNIVGQWALRSITKKEKIELCDLLAKELENKSKMKGGE